MTRIVLPRRPKLFVLASGGSKPDEGGSGFVQLVEHQIAGEAGYEIVGVGSNHLAGGLFTKSVHYEIPFYHMSSPYDTAAYRRIYDEFDPDYIALSGWIKPVEGLDLRTTFNIHPALLPTKKEVEAKVPWADIYYHHGGRGMWGHWVHERVMRDIRMALIPPYSGVSMHFVTPEYDRGPIILRKLVEVSLDWTPDDLARAVNRVEHAWQWLITDLVTQGQISWDGEDYDSLVLPDGFPLIDDLPSA